MVHAFQTSLLVALATCVGLPALSAQTTAEQVDTRSRGTNASRLDAKMSASNVRVSQLMGLNLQNSRGEGVGEIKDIVLNAKTGRVRYAVVTYGGFLGMGNKLFAVPFEALKTQVDPDEIGDDDIDEDDYVMVLDVTQQQLEGQQGFDEDNWPDMADKQWAADLDKRYNVTRNRGNANRPRRNNNQ